MRFFFAANNPLGGEAYIGLLISSEGVHGVWMLSACSLCSEEPPAVQPAAKGMAAGSLLLLRNPAVWLRFAGTLPPTWGINGSFPEMKTL